MGTQLALPKGHIPQFSTHFYCDQTAKCIKMPLGMEVGLGSGHIMLDPATPQKGGAQPPIFGPCLLWPNGWMDQDATRYRGRPRPRRHCIRWGPSSPPKGHGPQFSAHDCWGQTAVCIRIPLGTRVGLSVGDIMLDGDPAPHPLSGHTPPNFRPMYIVAKRPDG